MDNPWWVAEVKEIEYADSHPEGKTNAFIQWKGTDVCFDFRCECGADGHYDGYFAYQVRCPRCGTIWAMPSTVYPLRLVAERKGMAGAITFEDLANEENCSEE